MDKSEITIEQIDELLSWFENRELPKEIYLNKWTHILDVPQMVKSHGKYIIANFGKKTYEPYHIRLVLLKKILENS